MFSLRRFFSLCFAVYLANTHAPAEVIYDNTQFILSGYASENREYGDQLDLEGTARTLTELTFYYFGDFTADGDEAMKVRLYSNEVDFDLFRQSPTKLLYESGNMPLQAGYNTRTIDNLNVQLPARTVTFTIEFKGLATNEVAGLLFYNPPTVGSSFNEFWGRTANGSWSPFFYRDPLTKANAGVRLVAQPEAVPAGTQGNRAIAVPLHSSTNEFLLAQTFTPDVSGKLARVTLSLQTNSAPVEVSILDTVSGRPGADVLGTLTVYPSATGILETNFYDQAVFMQTGRVYAVQMRIAAGDLATSRILAGNGDPYKGGQLWVRTNSPNSAWSAATSGNATNLDAAFSLSIVPAMPAVRIISPRPGEVVSFGQLVPITIETNLPAISKVWRARFYDGNQELAQLTLPPYQIYWHATNSGPHILRVVVEDTFGRPFRAESHTVTVIAPSPASGNRIADIIRKVDGSVTVKFSSKTGERIRVEYGSDLRDWKFAADEIIGTGAEMTFTDEGPPKTDPSPKETPRRYYRVRFTP